MASRRRAAEDKNTKLLRELAAIPANKQCFDCLQRGPTYINVTIGSYVCTTCSGILRGLTPPHRVKSISMTTFTPEEIEYLKGRGNEYCKYVWLGTFDTTTNSIESEVSDDQKKRDFMVQKYEKKRWYVDPDIAVKKLQCDLLQRQKQGIAQPQNYNIRSSVPETQPLSRLLGKSPTPLVVQNNQNTEIWPHPVSSASAPTISTKTSAQNHGSRSIDLLSEFAANASASNNQASMINNSTANGNFANFDSAFNSVEKSASSAGPPATNLPSSASLDAYPMPRQLPQIPVTAFSPPLSTPATTAATTMLQSNADRYAALADLDSLFHQPTSTKAPSWTVETTSTVSMHDVPVASDKSISTSSAAPSNPFTSTDLWSHSQSVKPSFQSANPFQTGTDGLSYSQISSSQAYAPFPIPMVGNSPSDDNVRNQFNANYSFPTQMVTSPTNGYGTSQMLLQNGGIVSPTSGSGSWNMPTNMPMWSSSQLGLGGLFSSENKSAETAQHSDWIQNPVNPFMVSSNTTGFPVAPKNNCSNPFL